MYLHLGGTLIINTAELIAVENLEGETSLEDWLRKRKKTGKEVVDIAEGKPKSAIYTDRSIILSPISSLTLKKRLEQGVMM
ncbi:MAG TPA: extracellular matrix/biofilm biosynthesis regulator RemA family protein [Capillibacterium sp.]